MAPIAARCASEFINNKATSSALLAHERTPYSHPGNCLHLCEEQPPAKRQDPVTDPVRALLRGF